MNVEPTFNSMNEYTAIRKLSYNIIKFLKLNAQELGIEDLWKLLKYPTTDALSKPALTKSEKMALIYNGGKNIDQYRVFLQDSRQDVNMDKHSELRVFITSIIPFNYAMGQVNVCFEVFSHADIETLNNCSNRNDVMLQAIIKALNGRDFEGIPKLTFDKSDKGQNASIKRMYFDKEKKYEGYALMMYCTVADV